MDKRKQMAEIQLDIAGDVTSVWLSYEILEGQTENVKHYNFIGLIGNIISSEIGSRADKSLKRMGSSMKKVFTPAAKVINVILMATPFLLCWFFYYEPRTMTVNAAQVSVILIALYCMAYYYFGHGDWTASGFKLRRFVIWRLARSLRWPRRTAQRS